MNIILLLTFYRYFLKIDCAKRAAVSTDQLRSTWVLQYLSIFVIWRSNISWKKYLEVKHLSKKFLEVKLLLASPSHLKTSHTGSNPGAPFWCLFSIIYVHDCGRIFVVNKKLLVGFYAKHLSLWLTFLQIEKNMRVFCVKIRRAKRHPSLTGGAIHMIRVLWLYLHAWVKLCDYNSVFSKF